ncbi:MAG: amino acid ABC transporter permease [Candidatus Limnocylindrales bacterium]
MTDRQETRGPRDTGQSPSVGPERGSRAARQAAERRKAIRNSVVAIASSLTVFLALAYAIVNAPNWTAVEERFFDIPRIVDSLSDLLEGFLTNVGLFIVAELLVLVVALVVAVVRSVPGPAFLPFRVMATIYTDVFRAVPGVVWIFVLGFGIPGLRIPGVPREPLLWGLVALVLIYSAYVSEVYRAGIESVHPSQDAAARSLGLSRVQSLRYVVLPQAVRRVIPPLLNDFIGLQKDTVLISFIGVVEIFRTAQIKQSGNFNFSYYIGVMLVFIVITIPMTRLVDWLVAKERRARSAGGMA